MASLLVQFMWLEALAKPLAFVAVFILGMAVGCVAVEMLKAVRRWIWRVRQ